MENSKNDAQKVKENRNKKNSRATLLFSQGKQAQAVFDYPEAIKNFSAALEIVDVPRELAYEILDQRAECHDLMGEFSEVLADLDEMMHIAQDLGDPHLQTRIVFRQLFTAARMGEASKINEISKATQALKEEYDDISIDAAINLAIGYHHWISEERSESQNHFEQALRKYRAAGNREGEANTLQALGAVILDTGNQDLSGKYSQDALEIWRSLGNRRGEARALNAWSLTMADYAQKRDAGEEALEIFVSIGDRWGQCQMYNNLSLLYGHLGLYSTAVKYAQRAVGMVREMGALWGLALYLDSLARAEMNLGDFSAAEVVFREGQQVAQEVGSKGIEAFVLFGLGRVALMSGQAEEGREAIKTALESFREIQLESDIPTTLAWLGAAHLALGDPNTARMYTAEAVTELEVLGYGGAEYPPQEIWWWHYQALAYEQLKDMGEGDQLGNISDGAWSALQRAKDITMEGISSLSDEGLRRNYLNKVKINRLIITEWAKYATLRSLVVDEPGSQTGNVQAQLQRQLAIGVRMNERREISALTDFVMGELIELSGAERAMLVLVDEGGDRQVAGSYGVNEKTNDKFLLEVSELMERVVSTGVPVLIQDADDGDITSTTSDAQSSLSILCMPLHSRGITSGLIYVDNHSIFGKFNSADEDVLASFANQVASALENAQLYQDLEKRVEERTVELKTSNEALEQLNAELGIINSVQDGLATKLNFQEIIDLVGSKIQEIFEVQNLAISIFDRAKQLVQVPFFVEIGKRFPIDPFPYEENSGVLAHVIKTGKPLLVTSDFEAIADQLGSKHSLGDSDAPMAQSALIVPILVGELAIGTIGMFDYEDEAFNEADKRLLTTLANSMGVALENARLFDETNRLLDETQQRSAELAIITSVQEGLAEELDIPSIFELVGEKIREIFDAQVVMISTFDHQQKMRQFPYCIEKGERLSIDPSPFNQLTYELIEKRKPVVINQDAEVRTKELGMTPVRESGTHKSLIFVPMVVGDSVAGFVSLQNLDRENAFPESAVNLLTTLTGSMSVALDNARLFDETNRLLEETQQRSAELAIINSVQEALASKLEFQSVIDFVGDKLQEVLSTNNIEIRLIDKSADRVDYLYMYEHGKRIEIPSAPIAGISKYFVETMEPIVIQEDMPAKIVELGSYTIPGTETAKSLMAVPFTIRQDMIGGIIIEDYEKEHAFSDSDLSLLTTLAASMSVALENARLFDETNRLLEESQQRAAEMETVNTVGNALTSELDLDSLIELIGDQVKNIFNADITYVALYDRQKNLIEFPYAYGEELDSMEFGEGLTSKIIESAEPLLINEDVNQQVDEMGATHSGVDVQSYLGVPIMVGKNAIGVISVQSMQETGIFMQDDVRLLTTIAANVGAAIRNAQLYHETQQRADEMAALTDISREISATLDLQQVLESIANRAQALLHARTTTIRLLDEDGSMPTLVALGKYAEKHRGTIIKLGEGITGNVAKTGKAEIINDPRQDSRIVHVPGTPDEEEEQEAIIFAPLMVGENVIGVMGLWRDRTAEGPFSENDLNFLKNIARQAANAIQNARLFEEVQRQKLYSEALLENSPVAIMTSDLDNNVVSWNPSAEALFGYTAEEAIGKPIVELISDGKFDEEIGDNFAQIQNGGRVSEVTQRYRKDGSPVDVELLALPVVMEGKNVGLIAIYHDITELLRARHEAEAANDAKSAFLATMSHEIRTPMNGVIGMTSLLLETELDPEQRDYTETIRNSGEALLTVINDILDFSKIEAGKMELEEQPFDLRDCLESSLDLLKLSASEKGVELAYQMNPDVPSVIVGDITRLRQVLINLLNNGLKFTEQGEVVLSVETKAVPIYPDGPYTLHFSVCDTGIGIPPDRLNRLFQAFSQVDASTSRKYGGTGLGLAISKRLSELMGGEMWVESVEGDGTTFHFTIAVPAGPDLKSRKELRGEQPKLSGKRLLIVDDNLTNRRILTLQTRTWGMLPRDTADPMQALTWIRQGDPFDLAILDYHMPGMDGIELSRAIRELTDIPLVLFSSISAREAALEESQFAAYLMKPLKPSVLLDTLMNLFAGEVKQIETEPLADKATLDPEMAKRLPLRILLVEDNAVNQKLAVRLLSQMGYRADLAGNGLEAIQAVGRQKYDVVLMDVQMPEMDGLEASRRICARWPRGERPYIVAMTANAMQGDRERCLEAGMDDYVSKPIRVNELVAALGKAKPVEITSKKAG